MRQLISTYAARFGPERAGARRAPLPDYLRRLEAESIHIIREVVACFENPVMLYSIGKDSSVMLHLAHKAFWPSPISFPLLHVDTGWKFREMIEFRDLLASALRLDLRVHVNMEGRDRDIDPFRSGSELHTQIMKTEALRQALDAGGFSAAFGGARRDEEKSRAKERIFSFRDAAHGWDPKDQRPELWNLYNTRISKGESIRVFPLSNWTELDIWSYIEAEDIPVVPLYFAAQRPTVNIGEQIFMRDDERMPVPEGETVQQRLIRFRTLGCYPLTAALESPAQSVSAIIDEMRMTRTSERSGRVIDKDGAGAMEQKKREGYF